MAVVTGTASGLRPYLTVLAMAILRNLGPEALPEYTHWLVTMTPEALGHPMVMLLAGGMTLADFTLDKLPAVSQVWAVVQLVLRPMAAVWMGAQLGSTAGTAGAVLGGVGGAVPAAIVGFGKSSASAALPMGTGLGLGKSLLDDGLTMGLLWFLVRHPVVAGVLSALLVVFSIWLGLRLWRVMRAVVRRVLHLQQRAREGIGSFGSTVADGMLPARTPAAPGGVVTAGTGAQAPAGQGWNPGPEPAGQWAPAQPPSQDLTAQALQLGQAGLGVAGRLAQGAAQRLRDDVAPTVRTRGAAAWNDLRASQAAPSVPQGEWAGQQPHGGHPSPVSGPAPWSVQAPLQSESPTMGATVEPPPTAPLPAWEFPAEPPRNPWTSATEPREPRGGDAGH